MRSAATHAPGPAATPVRPTRPALSMLWRAALLSLLAALLLLPAALFAGCGSGGPEPAPTTPVQSLSPSASYGPALLRSEESFPITRDGETLVVPVYASQPLTTPDADVTRAVIAIHGLSRNANDYWGYAAAGLEGVNGVLLVAPQFAESDDDPASDQLYWANSDWSQGDQSEGDGRPWSMSSFGVLDELVASLRATFVNLRTVVVTGHSAGGQMTQRYAAASGDPGLRFVAMNPGSYLYLSPERPAAGGGFAVPKDPPADYDDYKYGLQDLKDTPYVAAVGAEALRGHYEAARVTYLLGALDTDKEDPDLDVSPPAMLQGAYRLQRGRLFFDYLGFTYGASIYERHTMSEVPGVDHDGERMFGSAAARAAMTQ